MASLTPPSTAPTSPASPTSTDGLVDCEKGDGSQYSSNGAMTRPVDQVHDHPRGYPQLSAFVNSDENFLIARKYGFLRTRVLLYRQDELSVLERDLIALDADDVAQERDLALQSRKHDETTDKDPVYSRKVLIQRIDDKLKEYDDLVKRIQTYVALKAPTSRNVKSFIDWIQDYKPLTPGESRFLEHKDDFVALADNSQENGWLDGVVEDSLAWCLRGNLMRKFFTSSEQSKRTDDEHIQLYSKHRIDVVVRLVLVLLTVALMVGPSAVLFLVPGHSQLKICLILIFTLFFAAALSVCTKARRHEMLAATAT
ncbi:hypothetical protein ACLMJK_003297 [Lecanora helva]